MSANYALLAIDMQRGLCEGDEAAVGAKALVGRINQLAKKARAVKAPVLWVHHEDEGSLQHGSAEWQLAQGLEAHPRDILVRKTTPDAFLRTGLERLLKAHGVDALVICGLQTQYCIDTTTRRALALGLPVVLVSDGHSTPDTAQLTAAQIIQHHNQTLSSISSFGPRAQLRAAADVDFES